MHVHPREAAGRDRRRPGLLITEFLRGCGLSGGPGGGPPGLSGIKAVRLYGREAGWCQAEALQRAAVLVKSRKAGVAAGRGRDRAAATRGLCIPLCLHPSLPAHLPSSRRAPW